MRNDCDKVCIYAGAVSPGKGPCIKCGWNSAEDERRKKYIHSHGLKKCKDKLRRLSLKEMRK